MTTTLTAGARIPAPVKLTPIKLAVTTAAWVAYTRFINTPKEGS